MILLQLSNPKAFRRLISLVTQKDTADGDNIPLMQEEAADGKITTAGLYKV